MCQLNRVATALSIVTLFLVGNLVAQQPVYRAVPASIDRELLEASDLPQLGRPAQPPQQHQRVAPLSNPALPPGIPAQEESRGKSQGKRKGLFGSLASKLWKSGPEEKQELPTSQENPLVAKPIPSYAAVQGTGIAPVAYTRTPKPQASQPKSTSQLAPAGARTGSIEMRPPSNERPSLLSELGLMSGKAPSKQKKDDRYTKPRRQISSMTRKQQTGESNRPKPKAQTQKLTQNLQVARNDQKVVESPGILPLALPEQRYESPATPTSTPPPSIVADLQEALPAALELEPEVNMYFASDEQPVTGDATGPAGAPPVAEIKPSLSEGLIASTSPVVAAPVTAPTMPVTTPVETQPIPTHTEEPEYPIAQVRSDQPISAEPSERSKELLVEAHAIASNTQTLDDYTAILRRCRMVLAIDSSAQAIAYANQLASWSLNKRGEGLLDQNQVEDAEADFREALRCNRKCWRAEHNLGVLLARRGDLEEAHKCFDRTIKLNPEFAKAYANRGSIAIHHGEFERALDEFQRAIHIDPDLASAHTGRGRLCHMLGRMDEALRHFDAAALLVPDDAELLVNRGDLLLDLGRYAQAKRAYERAIELDSSFALAYRNLAWMQATCPVEAFRDGEAAVANAAKATAMQEVEPDDIALDTQAAALAAAGRFEEAIELTNKAIEIAPEDDAETYRERLSLYARGVPFISYPFGGVEAATFVSDSDL